MKSRDIKELHTKTLEELGLAVKVARENLFSLSLEHAQKKLKNTRSIRDQKSDIARMETVLREKLFAGQK